MLDRLFGFKIHSFLHVLGFSILAFGLPLNKVLISIGSIWGVSNLILEGNYKHYWQNIQKSVPFLWILAFCLIHIIGLLWSSDISYGLHDLKIKLPLLSVPLALVARPIAERKQINIILYFLIFSLVLTSIINFGYYNQWFGFKQYKDVREMSLFGSHIRYGILISLGAGICLNFIQTKNSFRINLIWISLLIWFSIYTFYSQIISGAIALIVVVCVFLLYTTYKYSKPFSIAFGVIIIGLLYGIFLFLKPNKIIPIDVSSLPEKTKEGNPYINYLDDPNTENNKFIYISISELEMKREWNKISIINYDGIDRKEYPIKLTLMRYLTSKNLSKDAEGIHKLTKDDVLNIENGIASIEQLKTGMIARIYGIKYQINNNFDPNGHSLLQRLEYWKTGWNIAKENWLFGVGTGDVQIAFDRQYKKDNSVLTPKNRVRAHNMFLTVWISFGIFGLLIFLGFLFSYFRENIKNKELFPLMFIAVVAITFLIEDTLETQMGVSIFALFVGLFMTKIQDDSTNLKI